MKFRCTIKLQIKPTADQVIEAKDIKVQTLCANGRVLLVTNFPSLMEVQNGDSLQLEWEFDNLET